MIEEQYVSFDTAKMLKDAGFDVKCNNWYDEEIIFRGEYKAFQCPTQALAARWLREVYHIHIMITPMIDGWMVDLFDLKKHQYILTNKDANTDSYEQAFESGLQEAIKLIKK